MIGATAGALPGDAIGRLRPIMVGEDLLEPSGRRLFALLQKKGVQMVETSMALPHLILDHESGLLACDLAHAQLDQDVLDGLIA